MKISLNGAERTVSAHSMAELLLELQMPLAGVAVALNGNVVRRAEHQSTLLKENDEIEIIRAVQGG